MIDNRTQTIKDICNLINIKPIFEDDDYEKASDMFCDFAETIAKINFDDKYGRVEYITNNKRKVIINGEIIINNEKINYCINAYHNDDYNFDNMLKIYYLLSKLLTKNQTPHIILPMFSFKTNIQVFIDDNLMDSIGEKNLMYKNIFSKYDKDKKINILATEWTNRGNLLDFFKINNKNITILHWKGFLFQIISFLVVVQHIYPNFKHNNLKINNVFISKSYNKNKKNKYKLCKKEYKVDNVGYFTMIGNFDLSVINKDNNNNKNHYFDLHYFLATLVMQFSALKIYIPDEIIDFINRVIPDKYQKLGTEFVAITGKLKVNDEYTTPKNILENDILFKDFRILEVTPLININNNENPENIMIKI
jgi:hypothetical protein